MKKRQFYIRWHDLLGASHFVQVAGTAFANDYGLDLFLHKSQGERGYSVSDNRTGLRLAVGATRDAARQMANDNLARNAGEITRSIQDERTVSPAYGGAAQVESKLSKYGAEFFEIFGVRLLDYWDFIAGYDCGFNVVKFDDKVIRSGNDSMANVIRAKYGDRAHDLVKSLLEADK